MWHGRRSPSGGPEKDMLLAKYSQSSFGLTKQDCSPSIEMKQTVQCPCMPYIRILKPLKHCRVGRKCFVVFARTNATSAKR
ncbi:hypothetical protein DUNSADRAFT_110 [Dunaliella salina]|uniref:Encoded protein n=1 Tax=Dunaliella salina TaxID=3046 RepID=A0ABQ7H8X1_DUNSA|nr:hypothetical protein DUNSADRAFT_110 [Dunaliella salina]|eukprot:KAF5843308.1 hypothetical protein DUNSADRAFT_110 [Dunaliella salina]